MLEPRTRSFLAHDPYRADPTTAELLIGLGCFIFSAAVTLGLTALFGGM